MKWVESWRLRVGSAARWGQCALPLFVVLILGSVEARTVSTGTVYANPGASVVVPVTVDSLTDVGAAVVTVGYDPTVVVCLGAEAGAAAVAKEFTYVDSGNGRLCAIFSGFKEGGAAPRIAPPSELAALGGYGVRTLPSNVLMNVRFSVRDGTQGLFSDVTLQDVQLGAKDGVTDLSAANPLTTVNGMIRVLAQDASADKLEESFVVWPRTHLKTLNLSADDGLKADTEGVAIAVSQGVTASGVIPVAEPLGGWQSGSYALLSTPTEGLSFGLSGVTSVTFRTTLSAGLVTYWADVTVEGEIPVSSESGELDKATVAQIRSTLSDELSAHPEVKAIVVKGDAAMIPVIVDLGIAPQFDLLGTTATATYAKPSICITEFSPATGHVRMRVNPGEGNAIRTALASGCIHVYGTSDLSQKMRYISGTRFDLTPYLRDETKGEADLTVSLGTHTFIKIKAETLIKQEGETE